MKGCLDSLVSPLDAVPLRGYLGRSCNAGFLWLCSLLKTSQAAPGADRGPLSERTGLSQRRGRQQHSAGGPHPCVQSGAGHRQRRGDHQAAAGMEALAEALIFLPFGGGGWGGGLS